jgi:hypothetical protein
MNDANLQIPAIIRQVSLRCTGPEVHAPSDTNWNSRWSAALVGWRPYSQISNASAYRTEDAFLISQLFLKLRPELSAAVENSFVHSSRTAFFS